MVRGGRTTRVVIVDDHRAFAEALELSMSLTADIRCVGIGVDSGDAVELVRSAQPDVAIVDYRLQGATGIECMRTMHDAGLQTPVLMVTGHATPGVLAQADAAGAVGFVSKTRPIAELLDAVRSVARGDAVVDPGLAREQLEQRRHTPLTARQLEILSLMGEGLGVADIAERLFVSVSTVRWHVKKIHQALDVHSQREAVKVARHEGLIPS